MSSAKLTNLEGLGDIRGVIYDFEKAGDILEKHVHGDIDNHITIVACGRILAYSHDWETEVPAGKIIDFKVGEPHEIKALEDNTRIVNILKQYIPPMPTDSPELVVEQIKI
jgi:quercetin dioxygenase-like cupin family protein